MSRIPDLLALTLLTAGGCYAPDLRDCTVTCSQEEECAGDQVCNSAGLCATTGVACTGGNATVDAAPAMLTLRVEVDGTGKVVVDGVGECDDSQCTWVIPARILRFEAQRTDSDNAFERWTTTNCPQPTQTNCSFTLTSSTTVGAKFR